MPDDRLVIRHIEWRDVCPGLILLRAFRVATRPRLLLLAVAAMLLTTFGWNMFGLMFSGSDDRYLQQTEHGQPGALVDLYNQWPWEWARPAAFTWRVDSHADRTERPADELRRYRGELAPLAQIRCFLYMATLDGQAAGGSEDKAPTGIARTTYLLLCFLWAVAVWGGFGGAITRLASVELAADEQLSNKKVIQHTRRKYLAYCAAPLFVLVGALLVCIPMLLVALLMRLEVGAAMVAIFWPLMFLGGLILTILLLGLVLGWPLMWASISTESSDSFDALSRTYAYVFQRPLRYLAYVIVAVVLGVLGWIVVSLFASAVIDLTAWAASWGAGGERMISLVDFVEPTDEEIDSDTDAPSASFRFAARMIGWWGNCIWALAAGFVYSYGWTAGCAIYLLLRYDVDATEMDEVALDEEEQSAGLPPLKMDDNGVLGVADETPADSPADSSAGASPPDLPESETDDESS
ncbi:MAG: hypothetical protein IID44_20195 [Planctomycetes bacterium]|nr:hypothetical protein [Planctomycetota bacterium]